MGSRSRDLVATLLVIAIGIPYVGYLVRGECPSSRTRVACPRPAWPSASSLSSSPPGRSAAARTPLTIVAVVSLVIGVAALAFAETFVAEALLAVFMIWSS